MRIALWGRNGHRHWFRWLPAAGGGSLGEFLAFPPWEKLRKRRNSSERARGPPATLLTLTLPSPHPASLSAPPTLPEQGRTLVAAARPEAHRRPQLVPSLLGPRAVRGEEAAARPRITRQGKNVRPGPAEQEELPARPARVSRNQVRSPR